MNKDIKRSETPADERLAEIIGRFPELNMSNYTDVEVDRLNAWGIELCEAWDDTRPVAPTVSSSAAPSADPHWKLYADHFQVEPHEIDYDGVEWLAFVAGVDAALAAPYVKDVAAPVAGVTNAARVKNTLVINGSKDHIAASPVELTDIDALMLLEPFDLKQPANVKISIVRAIQRHLAGDTAAQGGE